MIHYRETTTATPLPPPAAASSLVEDMALAMRELAFTGTPVDRTSLRQKGFTGAQIDANWEAACDRANEGAVRRVA